MKKITIIFLVACAAGINNAKALIVRDRSYIAIAPNSDPVASTTKAGRMRQEI